jgi:hypothetical protein
MCVCVYVCMCICVYVYMCVCVYVYWCVLVCMCVPDRLRSLGRVAARTALAQLAY